jgi:hypothetical protein
MGDGLQRAEQDELDSREFQQHADYRQDTVGSAAGSDSDRDWDLAEEPDTAQAAGKASG